MLTDETKQLITRTQNLGKICNAYRANSCLKTIHLNLSEALSQCQHISHSELLVVTLAGGTGVGKSHIFNQLCSQSDASPSSPSVRGYTQKPYISISESNKKLLNLDFEAEYVPEALSDAVLIDTPDLDSIVKDNSKVAEKIIEITDIMVYVTTPDKRSDFEINRYILKWASKKRWLFVVNKVDRVLQEELEELKPDFDSRMSEYGFSINDDNRFFISALEPESCNFVAFKNKIFSRRSVDAHRALKNEACCRLIHYALEKDGLSEKLENQVLRVKESKRLLKSKFEQGLTDVLSGFEINHLYVSAVADECFYNLKDVFTLFMYPFVWFLARRRTDKGIESTIATIVYSIKTDDITAECETDLRRLIEDHGIVSETTEYRVFSRADEYKLQSELMKNIKEAAVGYAGSWRASFSMLFANLLPIILLLNIFYRALLSWYEGVWLSTDFVVHAVILMACFMLPGYVLLSKSVYKYSQQFKPADLSAGSTDDFLSETLKILQKVRKEKSEIIDFAAEQIEINRKAAPENDCGTAISVSE